jgi:hypothetical protein
MTQKSIREICARGHRGDLSWPRALWEEAGDNSLPSGISVRTLDAG